MFWPSLFIIYMKFKCQTSEKSSKKCQQFCFLILTSSFWIFNQQGRSPVISITWPPDSKPRWLAERQQIPFVLYMMVHLFTNLKEHRPILHWGWIQKGKGKLNFLAQRVHMTQLDKISGFLRSTERDYGEWEPCLWRFLSNIFDSSFPSTLNSDLQYFCLLAIVIL